jgi:hypothetical protein
MPWRELRRYSWCGAVGLSESVEGCGRGIRDLAAITEFVAFEGFVFSAFAEKGVNRDDHLKGQEDQPEVHAFVRAFCLPPAPKSYVAENAGIDLSICGVLIQSEHVP